MRSFIPRQPDVSRHRWARARRTLMALGVGAITVLATSSSLGTYAAGPRAASTSTCAGNASTRGATISIAYSATQEFNADSEAAAWFKMLKS